MLRDVLLDEQGLRPAAATGAATVAVVSGGATLVGAVLVVTAVVAPGGVAWFAPALQVAAAVLLIAGGARLAVGAGRGVLLGGIVAQFLTCAMHALYAVTVVADNPEDAGLTPVLLAIAGVFAALDALALYLTLRPSTAAFLS